MFGTERHAVLAGLKKAWSLINIGPFSSRSGMLAAGRCDVCCNDGGCARFSSVIRGYMLASKRKWGWGREPLIWPRQPSAGMLHARTAMIRIYSRLFFSQQLVTFCTFASLHGPMQVYARLVTVRQPMPGHPHHT